MNTSCVLTPDQCEALRSRWQNCPRLNELLPHFESIAKGEIQSPCSPVEVSRQWLDENPQLKPFGFMLENSLQTFYQHYCASIPYNLEDHCRVGYAISQIAAQNGYSSQSPFCYYESSSADGPLGRTIAEYCEGKVNTLTDSPNITNVRNFKGACHHPWSQIHHGPFFDVITDEVSNDTNMNVFTDGFDVVYANVTFQFYEAQRESAVDYICSALKDGGLFLISEKLKLEDTQEYLRREKIKDTEFKSQYFDQQALKWKSDNMLHTMSDGQAFYTDLVKCLKERFSHVWLTWNDGNFYTFACSNHAALIDQFVENLAPVYLPESFRFVDRLPKRL